MKQKILFTVLAMLAAPTAEVLAVWDITIESKTVYANSTDVMVSMYGSWDQRVCWISVPVVVRAIDAGSFWTGMLPYDIDGDGMYHPHSYNVDWQLDTVPQPWTTLIEEFRPGIPTSPCATHGDTGYDGVSPDHFCINAAGSGESNSVKQNLAFCRWWFDVTGLAGEFEFDTACFACGLHAIYLVDNALPPVNHGPTGTGDVTFHKGVITIQPGPPEHSCSFSGPKNWCAYISPGGEEPFTVRLRDAADQPEPGVYGVYLDFSACSSSEVVPCGDYPSWPLVYGDPSDANGEVNFHINAKGICADCEVDVCIPFCNPITVPVRTIDFDGDGTVTLTDWNSGPAACHDFNCNGVGRDGNDMFIFSKHLGSTCPGNVCEQLIAHVVTDPVGDYISDETIDVHFKVTNNNRSWSTTVTSMQLFWSEFGVEQTFYAIAPPHTPGVSLGPFDSYEYMVEDWVVPTITAPGDPVSLCLRGVLQATGCSAITAEVCWDHDVTCEWQESECDTTALFVPPGYSLEYITGADPDWTVVVEYAAIDTQRIIICKPENSEAGEGASVQFEIRDGGGVLVSTPVLYFEHEIRPGDCNSDCTVTPLDVQLLVTYVYRQGAEPVPWKNGNVWCPDGLAAINPLDVVYLVNYVYRSRSEPKDCPDRIE